MSLMGTVYDIFIDYTTGNSFSYDRVRGESLGIVTTDVNKAKENLKRIKDHHERHNNNFQCDGERFSLELLTDDGTRSVCPFWIGYFETLHGARIEITTGDDDMSFKLDG